MLTDGRVLCWFSCGAASAVAAKKTVEKYPNALVIYNDTLATEHPDNARFMRDVSNWIGKKILTIKSERYATVDDVIEQRRYMSGPKGALCTVEMKKIPRQNFQLPGDLHIFGLTHDEQSRIVRFDSQNDIDTEWILSENKTTKDDCFVILNNAGIKRPIMYDLGFKNNNCIGCVKVTSPKYWRRVLNLFPEVFWKRVRQSSALGVKMLEQARDGKKKRFFLSELPSLIDVAEDVEPSVECGVLCEYQELPR